MTGFHRFLISAAAASCRRLQRRRHRPSLARLAYPLDLWNSAIIGVREKRS